LHCPSRRPCIVSFEMISGGGFPLEVHRTIG